MSPKRKFPNPENPESLLNLKLRGVSDAAAGLTGVKVAVQHVFSEMGPARGLKALFNLNQKGGVDCPSCAWPDPDDDRSVIGEYCENGAKAIAEEATSKKLTAKFFEENSVADLSELNDYEIGKKGRLAEPMYLAEGDTHYRPISWNKAFEKIAQHLHACEDPNQAVFYTSGRTSNEAAFLYQLFVRQFGTNNLPDCSNMCHESSGVALGESLGIGKGSVKLEDFYIADVIFIIGQNPGTNHPRMLSALQKAKENGCTIISINPLPETGLVAFKDPQSIKGALGIKAKLTDIFLQVKINGDLPLLQAISHLLSQEEYLNPGAVFDPEFIENHTHGFSEWRKHIDSLDFESLVEHSGISEVQIKETVNAIKNKKKIIACWAMGLTQHKNAVDTIKEVVNLLIAKGSIAKPGAGTCPVRGHSNVQGDRTMGIYEKPSKAFLDNIERVFGFNPPREHGLDVVDCIKAMHEEKVKVFFAMGGNFLSATPDTLYTAEALQKTDLTVQVSTKLNRSHLITGREAIILPCFGRTDQDMLNGELQFVTTENSMGVIQQSKGVLKPVSDQLKSEPMIVCEMALAVFGENSKVDWKRYTQHYDNIRWDIERTIPGFDLYNDRVRLPGGFYLPNSAREGEFKTITGKANFNVAEFVPNKVNQGELMMMTLRSHDQFNTTIYGLDDRYRGISNERRVIFMNQDDIAELGFEGGERVDLYNEHGGRERVARNFIIIPFSIPRGCTATYFPEANVLVPIDSVADKSNTPTSKFVILKLKKHQAATAEHKNHLQFMQKFILIFLSLWGLSSANAQSFCSAPKIQRHTTVSASSVTKIQPHAIVAAAGGGFWATGTITTSADKLDFMVAKFNDSGRLVLLKRLGTSGDETSYPIGLAPTATGGCVIGGRSDDPTVGAGLAALAYINSDGTLKWWRRTTSKGNSGRYDAFRNVLVRKNGTVFGCGSSHQWNYDSQLLLAALDSNGTEIFRNSYRYSSQSHMDASAEYGSGYAVGGHDGSSPVVLTVTSAGVVDKFYGYSSPNYCPITSLVVSPAGKIYVTGGYLMGSNYELWVACINPSNGSFVWQKRYNLGYAFGSKIEWINNRLMVSFNQTSNGSNWCNGFAELDSNGNAKVVRLVKFNTTSFENHLAGLNVGNSSTGGWAFIGTNASSSANMSLSLIDPCDSTFCTIIKSKFNSVNNTPITLTSNKGTMYYDGKFATNLTPSITNVNYTQSNNCVACTNPTPTAFNDTVLCAGKSATYKVKDYKSTVLWSDGDTSHIKNITTAGTYTLRLTNACGTYRDTLKITNNLPMTGVLARNVEICAGQSINVDATQPLIEPYTYSWNDGNTSPTRAFNQTGTYILTTTDQCGSRTDTITVSAKVANAPILLRDTIFCALPIAFTQRISDYSVNVLWSDGDTSHIKSFGNTGKYFVTFFNNCGSKLDSFEIFLQSPPVKVLRDEEYFCQGNWITLKGHQPVAGYYTYEWSNGVKGPELVAKNRSTLTLTTTNECGSRTDVVEVYIANCDCEICIPDAFTPRNLDGRNDVFKPRLDCKYTNCNVKESYMRIYNRWGEKLHDAPVTEGWDGTFMGNVVPEGQYVYVIYIIFDSQVSGNRIKSESGIVSVLSAQK